MYHLVYTSHAIHTFSEADLILLLNQSRAANKLNNITGMLLYLEGKFIQVLEGDKVNVDRTYLKIKMDRRHTRVITVLQGNSAIRVFNNWTMGFKKLTFEDAKDLSGYEDIDVFFHEHVAKKDSDLLLIFLSLFYKKNMVDFAEL